MQTKFQSRGCKLMKITVGTISTVYRQTWKFDLFFILLVFLLKVDIYLKMRSVSKIRLQLNNQLILIENSITIN